VKCPISSRLRRYFLSICLLNFVRASYNNLKKDGWNISATLEELAAAYLDLDQRVGTLLLNAEDIKMWRSYTY
jgi:salicylate hydroxylase